MKINDKELDKVGGGYAINHSDTGEYEVNIDPGKCIPYSPSPWIPDPTINIQPAPDHTIEPSKVGIGEKCTDVR